MQCQKDKLVVASFLLAAILGVGTVLINNSVKALADVQTIKEDNQRQIDQIRTDTKDDLTEIKMSLKDLNTKVDNFILSQKT